ncbi:glycerophosphodiester phosphodiesterase [Actinomyces sp. 2119]|nr:glycerophosphodiester phosphodiesterase [Actinomyces sp. 2119]
MGGLPPVSDSPPPYPGSHRPGIIPMRPLSVGEVLEGAFTSLRTSPRAMLLPSLLVMSVIGVLTAVIGVLAVQELDLLALEEESAASATGYLSGYMYGTTLRSVPVNLLSYLATIVLNGLLIVPVSRMVLGHVITPAELWRRTRGRIWALIGQSLLITAVIGACGLLAVALVGGLTYVVVSAAGGTSLPVTLLAAAATALVALFLLLLVPALAVMLSLAPAALVLENAGVVESLRRSWRLVRSNFWRVAGILVLTLLIMTVVTSVVSVLLGLVSSLVIGLAPQALTVLTAVMGLVNALINAVIIPFSAAVVAVTYTDLRMRAEGLDVELRRATGA